jgi:hypothetical protein
MFLSLPQHRNAISAQFGRSAISVQSDRSATSVQSDHNATSFLPLYISVYDF